MQPLEHKVLSLSLLNKEDENVFRVGMQAWPQTQTPTQLQPHTGNPSHDNSLTRKTIVIKKAEKKRRARALVKIRYKVKVITQALPTIPTSPVSPMPPIVPTPTVASSTASTQMFVVKASATSIPGLYIIWCKGNLKEFPTQQAGPK